jgi:hypothetical protein
MAAIRVLLPLALGFLIAGCGTYVPEIQEIGGSQEAQSFVQAIVTNVTCEVQDAFYAAHQAYPKGTFLDGWGVQLTLALTTDEKGAVSPSANWLPPSPATAIFNLSGGATVSSEATRIDKMNSYYLVKDLYNAPCPPGSRGGPFLLQSDLKLKEWLTSALTAETTNTVQFDKDTADGPFKTNALYHEVKFEVISSGGVTPSWKLTTVSVNPTGSLLSASRDRTHDLIITVGPADKTYVKELVRGKTKRVLVAAPGPQAQALHDAGVIGAAVADAVRGTLRQ